MSWISLCPFSERLSTQRILHRLLSLSHPAWRQRPSASSLRGLFPSLLTLGDIINPHTLLLSTPHCFYVFSECRLFCSIRGTHISCCLYAIIDLSTARKEFGFFLNISRKWTYPVRYGSVSTLSTHLSLLFFHESIKKFLYFQLHPFDTALDSYLSLRQLSLYCLSPCLREFSHMAHVPYVQTGRTLKRLKVP